MDTIRPKGGFKDILVRMSEANSSLEAYDIIMDVYGIHPTMIDAANEALAKVPDGTGQHFLYQFLTEREVLLRA